MREFYRIYFEAKKTRSLGMECHFDIYGNNRIRIWEYRERREKSCICTVSEDEAALCYRKAASVLWMRNEGGGDGK